MKVPNRTKAQLLAETKALRQRLVEFETAEAVCPQALAALQASEARYRRLFEAARDGILILDAVTGCIIDVNPFLIEILGYSHAELLGRQLWEIGPFKDIAAAKAAFDELQRNGYIRYEDLPLEANDGRHLHVEFVSNIYWVDRQAVIQCNIRDITARQQAETALSQSLAELRERNAELDAFAQTVAHDLKNPVHLTVGYAEALALYYPAMSEAERQQALDILLRTGEKMGRIIDELLLLAELPKLEVKTGPLDMASIVTESVGRLAGDISASQAEIVWPDSATWPMAVGHGPWIEEVWVNYLNNALTHGSKSFEPPRIELGADVQPDGMVRYWVRDHGPGISPEAQSRLFAPFTRLDHVRPKGHGLGLSIVRQIVEKLNGQVGLTSEVGEGSTFYFALPVAR